MVLHNTETGEPIQGGGELTIEAMDKYSRWFIGRRTFLFARRCMRNPELRAKIKARAAEIDAEEAVKAAESL